MKRVTIKDIAAHLNLSVSTVSRALAEDKNIRKETRQRIFETARKLGYRPNPLAVSLRTGRSATIGLMVREMLTPASGEVLAGVREVVRESGINVILANSGSDPVAESDGLHSFADAMTDGIIIDPCLSGENATYIAGLIEKGTPVVFLSAIPDELEGSVISCNIYDTVFFLLDHLVHSGSRRILMVGDTGRLSMLPDMERAYRDVFRKFKIQFDPDLMLDVPAGFESGRELADRIIDNEIGCDAVFTCSELLALGVMQRLQERGVAVPGDVAVAAYGGTGLSSLVYPTLTAAETPWREMGRRAAELLIRKISGTSSENENVTLTPGIKLRNSSR